MADSRKNIAGAVLYMIAIIGLLPAVIAGVLHFRESVSWSGALTSLIARPETPIVFALLFVLGAGICIYLQKKPLLVALLPLLFIALMPLWHQLETSEIAVTPQFYYGQTLPGEGFERYKTKKSGNSWTIKIEYPEALRDALKSSGKKPIVLTSIGGNGSHWLFSQSGIYPLNSHDAEKSSHWQGFELYFKNLRHHHTFKGHGKISNPDWHDSRLDWPINEKWFVSWVVIIPEG